MNYNDFKSLQDAYLDYQHNVLLLTQARETLCEKNVIDTHARVSALICELHMNMAEQEKKANLPDYDAFSENHTPPAQPVLARAIRLDDPPLGVLATRPDE